MHLSLTSGRRPHENLLLAVDGSSYTKRMLAWLTTHEEWLSAPTNSPC